MRVDSLEALLKGGVSGPAIVRGEPDQSLLILAVRHEGDVSMPPKKKLAAGGYRRTHRLGQDGGAVDAAADSGRLWRRNLPRWAESARQFWAFQMPAVRNRHRSTMPDGLDPPSTASSWRGSRPRDCGRRLRPSKRALLRRATLDLLGIPPSVEESEAFVSDDSAQAYERVVDRLLASPRYGERWGRHWLDVVRYADSNGMDDNLAYSDAWRYRDYVIAAFNADKPFNRFLEEQIAGDLIAEAEPAHRAELLVATGFLAIGPKMLAEDDPVKQQMDIVDEQLDTTCRVFLGLTMGCARCHDHKFDPLATSDYYAHGGDLPEHADDALASRGFEVEHDGPGRLPAGAPTGGSRADHRPARQRTREWQPGPDVRRGACRPCLAARGGQEGIRDDPQGHDGRRGADRATSRSSCAAII